MLAAYSKLKSEIWKEMYRIWKEKMEFGK